MANAGKLLAVVLTLLGAGVVWVGSSREIRGGGSYELSVLVVCGAECPIAVTCEALFSRADADLVCSELRPPESLTLGGASARPFSGEPLTVRITTSQRGSTSGRQLSWFQQYFLVVIAEMPDGSRVGKVVDIPDGRVSKEVIVAFP